MGITVSGAGVEGKQVLILDKNGGSSQIFSTLTVMNGKAVGYLILNQTTSIEAAIPATPGDFGKTLPAGTKLAMESPIVKITVKQQ